MNDRKLQTVEQVRQFLEGSEAVEFRGLTAKEKYYWIEEVLIRFSYPRLKRAEKGVIRWYLQKVTGYSRSQVSRLISEYNIQETPFSQEVHPIRSWVISQTIYQNETCCIQDWRAGKTRPEGAAWLHSSRHSSSRGSQHSEGDISYQCRG